MSNHRLFCSSPNKRLPTSPLFSKLWNKRELSTSQTPEPVLLEETLREFHHMLRQRGPGSKSFNMLPADILSILFHYMCQWMMFMPLEGTRGRPLFSGLPLFPLAYDPALDYVVEFKPPEGIPPETITGRLFQYKNILACTSNRGGPNVHVQLKTFNMAFIEGHRTARIFPVVKLDCDVNNPSMEIGVLSTPMGPVLTLVLCGSNDSPYANVLHFWLYDLNAILATAPAEDSSPFAAYKKCNSLFPYYGDQQRAVIYESRLCYQSQFTTRSVPNPSKKDPFVQLRREATKYDPSLVHVGQTQLCVMEDDVWKIHPDMTNAPWKYLPGINRLRLMSTIHDYMDVDEWNLHHKPYKTRALGTLQVPHGDFANKEELWCFSVARDFPHVLLFSYRTRTEIVVPITEEECDYVEAAIKHDAIYLFRQNKTIDVYHYSLQEPGKMIKTTVPIEDNIVLDSRTLILGH